MSNEIEYRQSKIAPIIRMTLQIAKEQPEHLDNFEYIKAQIFREFPELADKSTCANCDASMEMTVHRLDWNIGLLLKTMAEEVRSRMRANHLDFPTANSVQITSLDITDGCQDQKTAAAKLGLIAKHLNSKTGKQIIGRWVITTRGWRAMRGERVPSRVQVWRENIEERYTDTATLSEVFAQYSQRLEEDFKVGKQLSYDYRVVLSNYDPKEWQTSGGYQEGQLT